jgi:zinc transport system substrate-binding protein
MLAMLKIMLLVLMLLLAQAQAFAAPKIVVSILPLHSLVAGVMQGVGVPELLQGGINSEHQASYSPLQISALSQADVVFMFGDNLELKLGEISGSDAVNGKEFVKLALAPGILTYRIRKGGAWEVDADQPAAGNNADPHIWLDPENAKIMVQEIARSLSQTDPENASLYSANAALWTLRLGALEKQTTAMLKPVADKPFIVFHDAYQYFEKRFGLNAVGSITDFAAAPASAARLSEIRSKVKSTGAACVFKEPQFSDAAVTAITEGSTAKIGVLDPVGASLTPGVEAYSQLLNTMAKNLKDCLSP